MKNEIMEEGRRTKIYIEEFQDTLESIDRITDMLQTLNDDTDSPAEQLFSVDYSKKPITAKVFPDIECPYENIKEGDFICRHSNSCIAILKKEDVEKIKEIIEKADQTGYRC